MHSNVKRVIDKFSSSELHNMAILFMDYEEDPDEIKVIHGDLSPVEVLTIAFDFSFGHHLNTMETLQGLSKVELSMLAGELRKNYSKYVLD